MCSRYTVFSTLGSECAALPPDEENKVTALALIENISLYNDTHPSLRQWSHYISRMYSVNEIKQNAIYVKSQDNKHASSYPHNTTFVLGSPYLAE